MSDSLSLDDTIPLGRYVVGLDLGTTNSAMAYVDTAKMPRRISTFPIFQIVAPNQIEARETMPSFHYQPAKEEFPARSMLLPWQEISEHIVGHFARDHGTLVPGRMIASAKSWLCHSGVDRTADLLPWHAAEDIDRISPVLVSARYLEHLRAAWDHRFPEHPLSRQDFILTIPASFDEVARELTIKAAKQAGLERVVLIEEPQAAFYAWIDRNADRWDQLVSPGQKILVCDVGGGTTDFTLIRVRKSDQGHVQFHRVAVGEHLILGGDNLDLALAHHFEKKVKPQGQLEPRQWSVLVRSCRQLKEILLSVDAPDNWTMTIPGSGSKLVGGSIQIPVSRAEVESVLAEGFFPDVPLDAQAVRSMSGFQEFGLPYASDPAITKHLATFLTSHRFVGIGEPEQHVSHTVNASYDKNEIDPARPDIVLFNGGVFACDLFRKRIVHVLERWFRGSDPNWTPIVFENERLDLAVARGAAYYGMVRRGEGVRIAACLARTYYIGVENVDSGSNSSEAEQPLVALCLLPAGIEPGQEVDLSQRQFQLLVSQPIEFPLFVSSTRLTDSAGLIVEIDPEKMKALPPIRTVLKTGKSKEATAISVILRAKLTEIGTLDLWCSAADGSRSWKLLFDVRSATQTEMAAHNAVGEQQGLFDDGLIQATRSAIEASFGDSAQRSIAEAKPPIAINQTDRDNNGSDHQYDDPKRLQSSDTREKDPASIVKRLEQILGMDRNDWPTSLLRRIWEVLIENESGRWLSDQHESRWLNMLGFSLRPGYGLAVDDWRCNETWKRLQGKLAFSATGCRVEWYVLWRRIAGGLTSGQQKALAAPLISQLKQSVRQIGSKGKAIDFGANTHESSELLRLLGACELLPIAMKQELGELLLEVVGRPRFSGLISSALWALGRVGARQPLYGPLNVVLPAELVGGWLTRVGKLKITENLLSFAIMQLARKTGDRYRDINEMARSDALAMLAQVSAPDHYKQLVAEVTNLETADRSVIFGESLPKGLRFL